MDLDHIPLNNEMLAGLYGHVLVDLNSHPEKYAGSVPEPGVQESKLSATAVSNTVANIVTGPAWKWLGENRKQVLVIVDHTEAVHLPDAELSFLTGIIGACKLSLADVAIVNRQQTGGLDHKQIAAQLKSRVTLLFGIEPEAYGLPVSFPAFQIQPFNQVSYLYAPSLGEVEQDKILKSKLWVCLRRLFNV